jgi:uncharacterized protein YicC (UPF0701 family)
MDYSLMSNEELEKLKEEKEIEQENILDAIDKAKQSLISADYESCDEAKDFLRSAIQELEYQAEQLKDEIEDIIEQMDADIWDNDYDDRMSEYRRMQGF